MTHTCSHFAGFWGVKIIGISTVHRSWLCSVPWDQGLIGNVHRINIKFLHAVNQLYRAYPQVLSVLKSWVRARGVLELLVARLFLRGMRLPIRIVDCEQQLCWRFSEVVKNPRKWVRVGFITFRKVVTLGVANKVFPGGKSPGGGGGAGWGGGGGLITLLGGVVPPGAEYPYPISDQNIRFSIPYFRPESLNVSHFSDPVMCGKSATLNRFTAYGTSWRPKRCSCSFSSRSTSTEAHVTQKMVSQTK